MLSAAYIEPSHLSKSTVFSRDIFATAILDTYGRLIYSDRGFRNFSKGNTKGFFRKVFQLKKRHEENLDVDKILPQSLAIKKTTLAETRTQLLGSNRSSQNIVPNLDKLDMDEFKDLEGLIDITLKAIQDGQLMDGVFWTYDGVFYEDDNLTRQRSYEITVSRLGNEEKVVLSIHDITEYTRRVGIEAKNRVGQYIINLMSQELRAPLQTNLTLVENAINNGRVAQSAKEQFLVPAYQNGKMLKYMINNVLDYSAIMSKKFTLRYQNLSLRETLKDCYQLLQDTAEKKGLEYNFEVDESTPKLLGTDHERVKQIVLCLLDNAIKFTFRGSVKIRAKPVSKKSVEISVKDTGLGLRPEELSKLKKALDKGEDEEDINEIGGNLAIANQLAKILGSKNHNGIQVQSQHVQGSNYTFILEDKNHESEGGGFPKDTDYSVFDEDITINDTEWNNTIYKEKRSVFTVF